MFSRVPFFFTTVRPSRRTCRFPRDLLYRFRAASSFRVTGERGGGGGGGKMGRSVPTRFDTFRRTRKTNLRRPIYTCCSVSQIFDYWRVGLRWDIFPEKLWLNRTVPYFISPLYGTYKNEYIYITPYI